MKNGEKLDKYGSLLDSDHPLIKEFRNASPATFKHSQKVANTMEMVASELGLNVKLMEAAGLLHDVGKMLYPEYFSENQSEDKNPHDDLDPIISYLIITRHVADTTNILLNDPDIPRELIEIVSQHHGTSRVRYFYNKNLKKKKHKGGFDYRYRTSKPRSIEAMILMILDSVEAASNSLYQVGKEIKPEELVEKVISECLSDRQFDDVSLKLGMLADMKQIIIKDLAGSFQKRVDYDETKENENDSRSGDE